MHYVALMTLFYKIQNPMFHETIIMETPFYYTYRTTPNHKPGNPYYTVYEENLYIYLIILIKCFMNHKTNTLSFHIFIWKNQWLSPGLLNQFKILIECFIQDETITLLLHIFYLKKFNDLSPSFLWQQKTYINVLCLLKTITLSPRVLLIWKND